jgi:phenylacetate-CoA ligase
MIAVSGIYTSLASRVLFPIHESAKGHATVSVRRALEKSQWWDAAELRELQARKLRAFLADAGSHVPYFRDLFAQTGFEAGRVAGAADLARLPTLTKPLIRANTERLKAADARRLARFNTGGSSGEPLVFYIGAERVSHDVAAKWRATRWWGVDIGDVEVVVWGSPVELGAQDWLRAIRDRILRTEMLPAFAMSVDKLDSFVERIRRRRPKMLFGYPSSLSLIARHAEGRDVRLDNLGIRVAFVTSERLYEEQRETIARVFGCSVANGYGGRDAGFIAHECPAGGMHITAEDIVVETVGPDGCATPRGEAGEIVVTHLATRDFPFIRYRTGDIGVLDDAACACGRGLPMLKEIQGRTTDFVVAHDGTVMHGLALIYVIRDLPGIESFKIIQESRERTRVMLVRGPGFAGDSPRRIVEGFKLRLGQAVDVGVELVERIPHEASGKFRYVVSNAPSTHAAVGG